MLDDTNRFRSVVSGTPEAVDLREIGREVRRDEIPIGRTVLKLD